MCSKIVWDVSEQAHVAHALVRNGTRRNHALRRSGRCLFGHSSRACMSFGFLSFRYLMNRRGLSSRMTGQRKETNSRMMCIGRHLCHVLQHSLCVLVSCFPFSVLQRILYFCFGPSHCYNTPAYSFSSPNHPSPYRIRIGTSLSFRISALPLSGRLPHFILIFLYVKYWCHPSEMN